MMKSIYELSALIQQGLDSFYREGEDDAIMMPVNYLLRLGGKRVRPLITLTSAQAFSSDISTALAPALAIEVFHNFTLMHDDIMDLAPLRRGQPTVHEKWNNDVAILSGDAMLIRSYQLLCRTSTACLPEIISVFNRVALDVCRGQQMDMEFQLRDEVTEAEYLEMIRLKTSVLLGGAAEIGAICGGSDMTGRLSLYKYAIALGMNFQLQDDYLDSFGNPEKTGKQAGGDILANKKTLLSIHALSHCSAEERNIILGKTELPAQDKIRSVKNIYESYGSNKYTEAKSQGYFQEAISAVEAIKNSVKDVSQLLEITEMLQYRSN